MFAGAEAAPALSGLGVVVLSYGDSSRAQGLIEELVGGGLLPGQVLVVHNPSQFGSKSSITMCSVLQFDENVGYGRAMNAGAAWWMARGVRHLLFLTHDVHLETRCIEILVKALSESDRVGAVAPRVLNLRDGSTFSCGGIWLKGRASHHLSPPKDGLVEWLDGCAVMVTAKAWERAGPFEERYFLYFEDVEFGLRLRSLGFGLKIVNDCVVSQSTGSEGSRSRLYDYCMRRNQLETARRYGGPRIVLRLIARSLLFGGETVSGLGRLTMLRADAAFLFRRFGPPPQGFVRGSDVGGVRRRSQRSRPVPSVR